MKFRIAQALAALLLAGAAAAYAETPATIIPVDPAKAAKAFYTTLREHKVDGLPQGPAWIALVPHVTEELATAILGAQAEQATFIKQNPDEKPPWIEGDLFSSLFEGPQQFAVGAAKVTGDNAEVPVNCIYTDRGETTKWTDTLLLIKTAKGWLIDDLRYGASWSFANKGTLKQSFAPEAG